MVIQLEHVGATPNDEDVYTAYDCEIAINWEKKTVRELSGKSEWHEFVDNVLTVWAGEKVWQKSDRKVYELVSHVDDQWFLVSNGHVTATFFGTEPLMQALKSGELRRVCPREPSDCW